MREARRHGTGDIEGERWGERAGRMNKINEEREREREREHIVVIED